MRPEDKGRERLSGFPVKGEAARLFFALWPDGEVRLALAALAKDLCRECGGRMVRASNIHLTLAFLGDVPLERISQLADAAGTMRTSTFDLAIDAQGYWRHNRILWAGAKACPPALRALALGLGEVRKTFGLAQDTREYAPHITLVRDARRAPSSRMTASVVWHASDFVLVRSIRRDGALIYEILQRWPLMPLV